MHLVQYILLALFLLITFPQNAHAQSTKKLPTITVINEIRGHQLGLENADLLASLKEQVDVTKRHQIQATWLWQYSALEESELIEFSRSEMQDQEFGIFLEIDRNTAEKAGVRYKGNGPWYHSDGLLLVSYDQYERRKLIDIIFEKFKEKFGYYPKSVGAWWVGSDAINYMREKYHVIAVLQCADQFATDAYSLWGTPWSIPYIPSKSNAAIPAQGLLDKQDNVVILQWATRDPLRAYGNSVQDSVYSVQDMKFPEIEYYQYLSTIFLQQPYDQTVIGLEGGLPKGAYQIMYDKQLQTIQDWQETEKIISQTSEEYATAFLKRNEILPPTKYFLTKDYKTEDQSFWYHSPYYRVGIQKHGDTVSLVDFRNYHDTFPEDFSTLPNTQALIRINTTAIVDTVRFPDTTVVLAKTDQPLQIKNQQDKIMLFSGNKIIAAFSENKTEFLTLPETKQLSLMFWNLPQIPLSIVFVLLLIGAYGIILWRSTQNDFDRFVKYCTFFFGVIIFFPILTNGAFFSNNYWFDSRFTFLLSYISWLPIDPLFKIPVTYQIIPLLMLIILHSLCVKMFPKKALLFGIVSLMTMLVMLFFADTFKELFEVFKYGKKGVLMGIGMIIITLSLLWLCMRLYKTRNEKIFIIGIGILMFFFLLLHSNILLQQKRIIITPFEMQALTTIAHMKKDVIFVTTKYNIPREEYKDVFPIIFFDPQFSGWITGVRWSEEQRKEGGSITLTNYADKTIVVPRYQGGFLYKEEEKAYRLKSLFDNAQIVVYTVE